ncbi:TPA: conjugal transfer protein TraL [Salmonella enterica subsp. enterica serovar 16:l,v:-]|nr:conjugal transfer protein TraL [Salmonella enterica]
MPTADKNKQQIEPEMVPVRHSVHSAQQGKGGCGKSVSTALLAMYKVSKGEKPVCIDTDPLNPTFSNYQKLNVRQLDIMEGDEINQRKLDTLIQWIDEAGDTDVIIDNGAPSFIPLSSYLISQQIPALLYEMGKQLVIHISIVGGQAHDYTVEGFRAMVEQYPEETRFVIWMNPYWGAVESDQGVPFEQSEAYLSNKDKIDALIRLPTLKKDLHGQDFADMLENYKTFDEAIEDKSLSIMVRQRLKQVRGLIFEQLDLATVI